MEQVFNYSLSYLKWVKDTQLSYAFKKKNTLYLDVDLPSLEDMPHQIAEIASRPAIWLS